MYINTTHFTEKPDCSARLPKEERVYDYLEKLGIPFEGIDHDTADTIEDCQGIDQELDTHVCKNLFLCNRQKTCFYLLMMPGEKPFITKNLSHQLEISRLSFADAAHMEELLDITPGAVSVMGLMNDREKRVNLLIDEDLLKLEYLGCHPCVNTSSLKLRTKDILKFVKATGHTFTLVRL